MAKASQARATRKARQAASARVELPTERSLEGANVNELIWLIYGPPGIGKSTFAGQFDAPLFLHTDPGLRFIDAFKLPISSWTHFKNVVEHLSDNTPTIYSTIVIDTVDLLFRMCRKAVCKRRGIQHQSDEEWGKGYDMVRDEFELPLSQLSLLPYGIVFISHSKEVEIKGRVVKTTKTVPSLTRQAKDMIAPICDVTAYVDYEDSAADDPDADRYITFKPSGTLEAKDRTSLLPPSMPFLKGGTFERIKAILSGEVKAGEGQPRRRKKARKTK